MWTFFTRSDLNLAACACVYDVECVIYDGHSAMLRYMCVWISISVTPQIIFVESMM